MSLYARTIRKMTGMPFDIPFNAYNLALYTSTGFITAKYTEHLSRLKAVGLIMLATATAMLVLGEVKINGKSQSIMPVLEKITPACACIFTIIKSNGGYYVSQIF